MTLLINTTLVALLLITAWQDFKHRGIWWGLLPLLLAGFAWKGIQALGAADWAAVSGVNLALVLGQLIVVAFYFSVRNGKLTNILKGYFGLGDLLFFVVAAGAFSTPGFLAWYLAGLTLTLIGVGIWFAVRKPQHFTIPLAGSMALVLIAFMGVDLAASSFDLYTNNWLMALL